MSHKYTDAQNDVKMCRTTSRRSNRTVKSQIKEAITKKKAEEIAINVIKQIEMIRFIMVFPA